MRKDAKLTLSKKLTPSNKPTPEPVATAAEDLEDLITTQIACLVEYNTTNPTSPLVLNLRVDIWLPTPGAPTQYKIGRSGVIMGMRPNPYVPDESEVEFCFTDRHGNEAERRAFDDYLIDPNPDGMHVKWMSLSLAESYVRAGELQVNLTGTLYTSYHI